MANEKHSHPILNHDQIKSLTDFIIDSYGSGLPEDELTDVILLLLEDISGFETVSDQSTQHVIHQIRNQYYDRH